MVIEAPITTEKVEILKNTILQNPIFEDKGISPPPITDAMIVEIAAGGSQCQTAIEGLVKDVEGTSFKEDFNDLATDPNLIDDVINKLDQIKLEKLLEDLKNHKTESNFEFKWANYYINNSNITSNFEYNGKTYEVYAELGGDGNIDLSTSPDGTFKDFGVKVVQGNNCHTEFYLQIAYAGSNDVAIELKGKTYEDFDALLGKLGLTLTTSYKTKLTNKYKAEIQAAGNCLVLK